jgi:uncharacterized membrane protein
MGTPLSAGIGNRDVNRRPRGSSDRQAVFLLILTGVCLMLAGLGLLLAMVIRLIEPGLGFSLSGYAGIFAGLLLGLAGIVRAVTNRN